jgi:AraC family transcriptional regulator
MLGYSARLQASAERVAPKWLDRIIDRLDAEFADKFSSEDLADTAGVHPVHLAAVFRRFRGQTIGEYVQQLRISHASRLMIDRELPLADIAFESGFSDQSHLTRMFKRYTGLTPGAFRASLS